MGDRAAMRFAAMIANQRSGTHMMRSAFNCHPQLICPPEPMYRQPPPDADHMKNFLRGLEARLSEWSDWKCDGPLTVVIDVKYRQVTPAVEAWLGTVPVIHLLRADILRIYYSLRFRHYYSHGATAEEREQMDAHEFVMELSRKDFLAYAARVRAYRERLASLADIEVSYEALTGNATIRQIPKGAGRKICRVLGVDYWPMNVGFSKRLPGNIERLLRWVE